MRTSRKIRNLASAEPCATSKYEVVGYLIYYYELEVISIYKIATSPHVILSVCVEIIEVYMSRFAIYVYCFMK